jgi:hypothetical protein
MLHCNMNLAWQHSYALQLFQAGRVVKLDGGGGGCERLQRANKITRGGNGEMRQQRFPIGPLFDEHQPQRIFTIDMDGVGVQPGSRRERRTCSRLNLLISLKESSRAVTLPVTTIIAFLRGFGFRSPSCPRIAGAGKVDRLLRPAL